MKKPIINGYDDPAGYKDERVLPIIYELDKREEWIDPKCWKKQIQDWELSKTRTN